jgi:hypothetical protein
MMDLNNHISVEKLDSVIRETLGRDWNISPLTEISKFIELKGIYYWDLYVYRFNELQLIERLHKRFIQYDMINHSMEDQLRGALLSLKEEMEMKLQQYPFYLTGDDTEDERFRKRYLSSIYDL